ncbi:MAG TPA: hypothetical protein PLI09_03045 [Candidatus Hydrogenedentes bacterium]|nr:hypothetical protein [Candidatus Hydrogenedentota bacterium]
MSRFDIHGYGFHPPFEGVNGRRAENVCRLDLFRTCWAMTLQSGRCFGAGEESDLLERFDLGLRAQLMVQVDGGAYKLRPTFNSLRSEEKRKITESLEETFIKLALERRLGIPWLVRLDPLLDTPIRPAKGLVGQHKTLGRDSKGRWHLVEVGKVVGSETRPETENQGRESIIGVNGQPIATCTEATVRLEGGPIRVDLKNSAPNGSRNIVISEDVFFTHYYSGLKELLLTGEVREEGVFGMTYMISTLDDLPSPETYEVGLSTSLVEDPSRARSVCNDFLTEEKRGNFVTDQSRCIGPDGVMVEIEGYASNGTKESWGDWFFEAHHI